MTPRVIDNGTKVGWGLIAFIITVYGLMVTTAAAVAALLWKRWGRA